MRRSRGSLVASCVAALATGYALRPARTPGYPAALSLAVAWPAAELPLPVLAVQAVSGALAVRRGALRDPAGRAGLLVAGASAIGSLELYRRARGAGEVLEAALVAGLGPDLPADPGPTVAGGAVRAWRSRRRFVRDAGLTYGPDPRFHVLDVWRRPDLPRTGRAPVLLQIPGGGYVAGNKQGQAYPLMSHLAESGWVCVSISYRLAPEAAWPAQIVDVKRALVWVREHIASFGGDPGFVAVTGGSAGAQLAALTALTPGDPAFQPGFEHADTSVQAAVPLYGVYDWTPPAVWADMQAYLLRFGVMTRSYAQDAHAYEQASPACRIGSHAPPFFVVHGGADVFAPASQAQAFVRRLREAGGTVVYAELPGAQHAFDVPGSPRAEPSARAVVRFLTAVHDRGRRPAAPKGL